jgi:gustatory receptor
VDEHLKIVTSKRLRMLSIIMIFSTFIYLGILSLLDYVCWSLSYNSSRIHIFNDKGPINYCPLYFMYIIIMTFEMQYALILFNVGERFLKINTLIMNFTKTNSIINNFRKDMKFGKCKLSYDFL